MQKKYLSLVLPSFLSGCAALHSATPATDGGIGVVPALVFVDGQISDSEAVIAHTQQRLQPPPVSPPGLPRQVVPSTPAPQTGTIPHAENLPLPSPSLVAGGLPHLVTTGTPSPLAVTWLAPARNRTVSQWIRLLLPAGWQFRQENAATPKLNTRLASWSANDQWPHSLSRLLEEQHLWGHIDWQQKTLTVTTSATSAPAVTTAKVAPVTASHNPFRGTDTTTTVRPGSPAVTVSPPPVTGTPVAPVPAGKEWRAPAGTTLRENLTKWAEDTPCDTPGIAHWMVIWPDSVKDYRLDAPLIFRGSFEAVTGQVFDLYRTAIIPLYAQGSRMQCVITVTDTEDGS
ncbi:pili assembly chaperone [Salmonella enterica]|nr:pili assembly chaperone [Salmonella enterica]EBD7599804.1 pili assembly chaperone [Salmonella enterica]EHF8057646.1 pili assembly chaperone [Salmonella enterica subsp. enterica serovar Oranienburg]EHJ8970224.1 toxin co-regulated pilus biosynthesis Q family protein [Salmonella enterica]